jgi:hypothetical protein
MRPSQSETTIAAIFMRHIPGLIILITFYCCKEPKPSNTSLTHLDGLPDNHATLDTFRYKDLFEGHVDTVEEKEISGFYGTWRITAIANAGGTILEEKKIKSQIGKKLILNLDSVWSNFLDDTSSTKNPKYFLEYLDTDDGTSDLRGTTFSFGYRDCRKNVIFLRSTSLYLEIIHFGELAEYYDGRIYIYTKEDR